MSIIINPTEIRKKLIWLLLAVFVYAFSHNATFVERFYSQGLYKIVAQVMRWGTGWCGFSFGDILYLSIGLYLLFKLIKTISVYKQVPISVWLQQFFGAIFWFMLKLYVVFMWLWGLNYSRVGISEQVHIRNKPYGREAITQLTNELIDSANAVRKKINTVLPEKNFETIIQEANLAYLVANKQWSFLAYKNQSVKKSMFTVFADYGGFIGYYNPFSGEAQLRYDIPGVMLPYVACHEMAHQLGYASEDEANLAGYLACSASTSDYFRYSVYLDLLNYALAEQYRLYASNSDFNAFAQIVHNNRTRMDTLVKADRKMIRLFFDKRRNSVAPVVSTLYDQYLRMNKQLAGIKSYELVIGWLIAYKEKYGKI